MPLQALGFIELPAHVGDGGFDHAAVHPATGHVYVAHTANDALDAIGGAHEQSATIVDACRRAAPHSIVRLPLDACTVDGWRRSAPFAQNIIGLRSP